MKLMRLVVSVLVIVGIALLVASDVGANPDTPVDESVPELVTGYITFPCDFLEFSYKFQEVEVRHIEKRMSKCIAWVKEHNVSYGNAICDYVEMERLFMYAHLKSVGKAIELMCNENGTQKNPEHEIEF